MKRILLFLVFVFPIIFTSCQKKQTLKTQTSQPPLSVEHSRPDFIVEPNQSTIHWAGFKPTGKHEGTVLLKEGSFEVNEGKISGGNFVLDLTSIKVSDLDEENKLKLEAHLKGTGEKEKEDHFFHTTKFPTGKFELQKIVNNKVFGFLTLKNITQPVEFSAKVIVKPDFVLLESDTFNIDRTLWGINYASKSVFDDLKNQFIEDKIELFIKIKAHK